MATKIQLFYDVLSPYSWIAFEILCRYRSRWSIDLQFCPFFLGGVMNGTGNRPPGMLPAKGVYMSVDLKRQAKYYQIPIRAPSNVAEVMFQKGSLSAQRLLTAVKLSCPEKLENMSRQLWVRIWSQDQDITANESLKAAGLKAGLSEEAMDNLIGQIKTEPVKEELKRTTQEALDLGAFGAPFIVAEVGGAKEPFFGSDRMELLAHTIGERWEGPLVELRAQL